MKPTMMLPLVAANAAGHSRATFVFDLNSVTAFFYTAPYIRSRKNRPDRLLPNSLLRDVFARCGKCPNRTGLMSFWIIVGFSAGLAAAGLVYRYINHPRDVGGAVLVMGMAALAVGVTFVRVEQYRDQQRATAAAVEELVANSGSSSSGLRLSNPQSSEPINAPIIPIIRPPAGNAPPASPHSGD
jgi:hypothetical protein